MPLTCESNVDLSSESYCIIELYVFDTSTDAEVTEIPDGSSGDDLPADIVEMVSLRQSTRLKRPVPRCLIWDYEISGESSEDNGDLPCQIK